MKSIIENASFISNKWVKGKSVDSLRVVNKYSGHLLKEINYLSAAQIEKSILSSLHAFNKLKTFDAQTRSQMLENLYHLLNDKKNIFSKLICEESGKPIKCAVREVERTLFTLKLASEEALRINGDSLSLDVEGKKNINAFTRRFPIGVILCISPFNFPLNLALHKIGPALASGNSVILKPSPLAPLSSLLLAQLVKRAGYPAGSLNVVICEDDLSLKLVQDHKIKMLSFTGSPAVGWFLKEKAKKKKVTLELGGNAGVIVDESADIKKSISKIIEGAFSYSGQTCISTQRVYIHKSIYDKFSQKLLHGVNKIICGNPKEKNVVIGPIINKVHMKRINTWISEAVQAGARILKGGYILDKKHNLYPPTILTNTNSNMKVVKEEIFGPIIIIEKIDSFEEGVKLINHSRFGLQAGIFTNNIKQMKYAFNEIEVGSLIVNEAPGFRVDNMPYGGIKDSGLGLEGVKYAIDDMTKEKLLVF